MMREAQPSTVMGSPTRPSAKMRPQHASPCHPGWPPALVPPASARFGRWPARPQSCPSGDRGPGCEIENLVPGSLCFRCRPPAGPRAGSQRVSILRRSSASTAASPSGRRRGASAPPRRRSCRRAANAPSGSSRNLPQPARAVPFPQRRLACIPRTRGRPRRTRGGTLRPALGGRWSVSNPAGVCSATAGFHRVPGRSRRSRSHPG